MDGKTYYALTMWDPALPGFVSGEKSYYGTMEDMEAYCRDLEAAEKEPKLTAAYRAYCAGEQTICSPNLMWDKPLLEPVTVFAQREFSYDEAVAWEHLNIWKFLYNFKADACRNTHLWLRHGERYLRCIRPAFLQLYWEDEIWAETRGTTWRPVWKEGCWGNPLMLVSEELPDGRVRTASRFFVTEQYFDTEEALQADILAFDGTGEYRQFCNEIFGDG